MANRAISSGRMEPDRATADAASTIARKSQARIREPSNFSGCGSRSESLKPPPKVAPERRRPDDALRHRKSQREQSDREERRRHRRAKTLSIWIVATL